VAFAIIILVIPTYDAIAQSPEMPLPVGVIKDADGKTIAQFVGFDGGWPMVLLNLGGRTHGFGVHFEQGTFGGVQVWFSEDNCTGDPYILYEYPPGMLSRQNGVVAIAGPDATDGSYMGVFRTTSLTTQTFYITGSRWYQYDDGQFGKCINLNSGTTKTFYPAEEILPNPMAGFHGPSEANPERVLTLDGGTKLP
jgi:hypothetical protein